MKQLLAILILLGGLYLVKQLFLTWNTIKNQDPKSEAAANGEPARAPGAALPGLPASLENALQSAEKLGATGVRNFLIAYRPYLRDPRLADIELDYVVLVSSHDPAEARRVFKSVKDRLPASSPLQPRIKKLEKTYE